MKIHIINERGLGLIKDYLEKHHRLGDGIVRQRSCLFAWAEQAERDMDNGASVGHVELKHWETYSGHMQTLDLYPDCFDIEVFEDM